MLLYNGVRISELLDLKKENVHLDEQYFNVISSKTENGICKVPIADKVLPFYQSWFDSIMAELVTCLLPTTSQNTYVLILIIKMSYPFKFLGFASCTLVSNLISTSYQSSHSS